MRYVFTMEEIAQAMVDKLAAKEGKDAVFQVGFEINHRRKQVTLVVERVR